MLSNRSKAIFAFTNLPTQQFIGLAAILHSILQYEMDLEHNASKRNIGESLAHWKLSLTHTCNIKSLFVQVNCNEAKLFLNSIQIMYFRLFNPLSRFEL